MVFSVFHSHTTIQSCGPVVLATISLLKAIALGYAVAPSTARFLCGMHADSANWNNRLFRAACDMNARGVPLQQARTLLMQGAKPRTTDDEQAASDTIAQGYKEIREPSRC